MYYIDIDGITMATYSNVKIERIFFTVLNRESLDLTTTNEDSSFLAPIGMVASSCADVVKIYLKTRP